VTAWQAILLGLLQGATELFPVSSLGHAVLLPPILRWSYRQSDPVFVPFLVLLHLGTATALLVLYRRDWSAIVRGLLRASIRGRVTAEPERLGLLLVVGTVPAGVVGFFGEKPLKALFASPRVAAGFLVANGLILLGAEVLRRRDERRRQVQGEGPAREESYAETERLAFWQAAVVGACQALALLPGISRSGVTMAGGLVAGLRHQEAARFSFLLATPIIAAAGVLELPELAAARASLPVYVAAALISGVAAYLSARFLIRYFRAGRLTPYGIYCLAAGVLALFLLR
jgi:undecaprenyl-diphosphatase